MAFTSNFRSSSRPPALQLGKTAVATALSWVVAGALFPANLPTFAAIAALLVVQPSVNQSFAKALERSVGVIAGVAVGSIIGVIFGDNSWIVLLAVVAAIAVGWIVKLTPGSAVQVPISAMLVLSVGSAGSSVSAGYAVDRILETLIGAAIGVLINAIVVPPVIVRPAERDAGLLARQLAAGLDGISEVLRSAAPKARVEELLIEARLLRPMLVAAEASIKVGEDSLRLNPRRSAHRTRLEQTRGLVARLNPIVTRVVGMTRAVRDHYDDALHEEPTIAAISVELERAAHDLRLVAHRSLRGSDITIDLSPVEREPKTSPASPDHVHGGDGRDGGPPPEDGFPDHPPAEPQASELDDAATDARARATAQEPPTFTTELPALTAPIAITTPHPEHWILIGSLLEDIRRVREEILDER